MDDHHTNGDVVSKGPSSWSTQVDDDVERQQQQQQPTTVGGGGLHHDHVAPEAIGGFTHDLPVDYYRSANFLGTLVATCLAQISGYLGWVLPANTISLIIAELGPSPAASWLALSWQAGFAVGFLWVGRLSDIFGRRWFFTACSIFALVGNIVGSTAQSINMLIACNCINGLAASGQLSFSVVLGELVANKNRGLYNAIVLSTSTPFAVFGPPIMRAFFENTTLTFRWSYILGVIVNTLAIILYYFFYHPPSYDLLHVGGPTKLRQLLSFDWTGTFLFTTGLVTLLIALNWAGSTHAWSSPHVLGGLFGGLTTLLAFGIWEAHCPHEYPLMPMTLFRNAHYNALVACASVGAMVYYSGTVLWPGLAAALFTASVPRVGWLSCAVGGGILLGQLAAGLGVRHLRRMRVQMTLAGAITVAGIAAVASATTPATESRTVAFVMLGSAGAGYVEILALSTVALVWPRPHDIGLVAGVLGCIRTAAAALATSVYLSVLSMERTRALAADVAPVALRAGLPPALLPALLAATESQGYAAVPGLTDAVVAAVRPVAQHAYAMAYRTVFLCTLPFGLILLVAAVGWCPDVEDYMTEEVARKLQRGGAGRRVKLEVRKGREVREEGIRGGGGGGGGEGR